MEAGTDPNTYYHSPANPSDPLIDDCFYRNCSGPPQDAITNTAHDSGYFDDTYFDLTKAIPAVYIGAWYCATSYACLNAILAPNYGGVPLAGLAILATTCPKCGGIRVELAGDYEQTNNGFAPSQPTSVSYTHDINLTSSGTKHGRLFVLPHVPKRTNNSELLIYHTGAGKPEIEGIGVIWPPDSGRVPDLALLASG
jgi:hypothetical protein